MLTELGRGIYAQTGFEGGNCGLIRGERGSVLVDTPMLPPDARAWLAQSRQLGASSIYGIVNTDYHPEHFLGNAPFLPARIVSHELAAKQIARYRGSALEQLSNLYREVNPSVADEISRTHVYDPEICVDDRLSLYLGDRRVDVLYLEGHTPASLGVFVPEERVLFVGDNLVCGEHPVMSQANTAAWLKTLETMRRLEPRIIVPGIGAPCAPEAIELLATYIGEMRRRVAELFQAGASRRECVEKTGMLDFFPVPEEQATRLKRRRRENVERVYAEMRASQPRR